MILKDNHKECKDLRDIFFVVYVLFAVKLGFIAWRLA